MSQPSILYVSLLRTGSRSIRTALFPLEATSDAAPCYWTRSACDIREDFERRGWDWSKSFKFTVVRNPWDRLVSAYEFWKPRTDTPLGETSERSLIPFAIWIQDLVRAKDVGSLRLLQQWPMLSDTDGNLLIDQVFRFETIRADWKALRARYRLAALGHTHKTLHLHYSRYYDEKTRALVQDACQLDLLKLGYEFEHQGGVARAVDGAHVATGRTTAMLRAQIKRLARRQ